MPTRGQQLCHAHVADQLATGTAPQGRRSDDDQHAQQIAGHGHHHGGRQALAVEGIVEHQSAKEAHRRRLVEVAGKEGAHEQQHSPAPAQPSLMATLQIGHQQQRGRDGPHVVAAAGKEEHRLARHGVAAAHIGQEHHQHEHRGAPGAETAHQVGQQAEHQRVAHVEQRLAQEGTEDGGHGVRETAVGGQEVLIAGPQQVEQRRAIAPDQGERHIVLLVGREQVHVPEHDTSQKHNAPIQDIMPSLASWRIQMSVLGFQLTVFSCK